MKGTKDSEIVCCSGVGDKGNGISEKVSKYKRKNTNIEIVCKNCGKKAIVHSSKALFCSRDCAVKWRNDRRPSTSSAPKVIECAVCGKKFKPFSVRAKYCSKECAYLFAHVTQMARKSARNRVRIGGDRKCLFCGDTFTPYTGKQICCSTSCYNNWRLSKKLKAAGKGETVEERVQYTSMWHVCPNCGEKFVPQSINQYCCSKKCGAEYRAKRIKEQHLLELPERTCIVCGKKFRAKRDNRKCCSMVCSRANAWRRWKDKDRKNAAGYVPLKDQRRTCIVCGKEFTPTRPNQICCTHECSSAHLINRTKKFREGRSTGRRDAYEKVEKTCLICGKKFETSLPAQKYCSVECYTEAVFRRSASIHQTFDKEESEQRKRFEFMEDVARKRKESIPEFTRVAMLPDSDRIKAMKDWDEEKRNQFIEMMKKRNRVGYMRMDIGRMTAERKARSTNRTQTSDEDAPK